MKFRDLKLDSIAPLLTKSDVQFAGVFGSYARDEAKNESDIDILVRFSKPKTLLDIIGLELEVSDILKNKIDLVTEGSLSPYLKDSVLQDLKIFYGKR